jgi:hypothetical protein
LNNSPDNQGIDINETDIITGPLYPVLKLGDIVLWDFTNLDKADEDELLTNNDILQPKKKNENYVTFCKCDFNIRVLIYERATSDEILSSWLVANKGLKLDRVVRLSLHDSLYNLYLTKYLHEEPDTVLILRLVYWYYRCSLLKSHDSFKYKTTEVKRKLIKRLLKKREIINMQLDANASDSTVLKTLLSDWESRLTHLRNNKSTQKESDEPGIYRTEWFKAVWNITSELLLAAICGENGFNVTFDTPSQDPQDHDYDFIVNDYPVQVKSLNTLSPVNSKQKRKQAVDDGIVTYDLVITKILNTVTNNIDSIDHALKQGAKIIFINGTSDESGSYFSQFCMETHDSFCIKKSLDASIDLAGRDSQFVPVIFCATSFRLRYYINTRACRIPVVIADGEKKVDKSQTIELLNE